ncbi:hypothetical protein ACWGID_30045 [Kribbella sp. NPDC054772]
MRKTTRVAAALATTAALVTLTATQASAAVTWLWQQGDGNNIGTASYTDTGNVIKVNDQEADGHSLLLFVHKPGVSSGWACWDHSGADTSGTTCTLTAYDENTLLEGYLCRGEWATNPADRVIFWDRCYTAGAHNFRK